MTNTVTYQSIDYDVTDRVATITLNRPEYNILNIEMMSEISEALDACGDGEDLKALVFAAEGKAFSAGVDIAEHTEELTAPMLSAFHKMFRQLERFSCPTIALVQGAALGGGCELACFCDIVIASDRAKFGQPEIQVGVFPPVATAAFSRFMHQKQVYDLLLTGDRIDAQEAKSAGLVSRVLPHEDFTSAAREYLGRLTGNSAVTLRLTKRAIRDGINKPFLQALSSAEELYLDEAMKTKDAREGINAFLEKRKPCWSNS